MEVSNRHPRDVRRAVLEHELKQVGCTLRRDSRLCMGYLNFGVGDVKKVAITMAEMKFFFRHTDYKEIHNAMYEDARRSRRPFDAFAESKNAKHWALEGWIRFRFRDDASMALKSRVLPPSLSRQVFGIILSNKFWMWVKRTYDLTPKSCSNILVRANRFLFSEASDMDITHYTDDVFREMFGEELGDVADMFDYIRFIGGSISLQRHVEEILESLPYSYGINRAIRHATKRSVDMHPPKTLLRYEWNDKQCSMQDALRYAKEEDSRLETALRWHCQRCDYVGSLQGVIMHSNAKHGTTNITDVRAISPTTHQPFVDFRKDVYDYIDAEARAAITIQRAWRLCISCPDYLVCRNRLTKEHEEICGMFHMAGATLQQ